MIKALEPKVKAVLVRYPRTRDDDRELTLQVWQTYYGINPWMPVCEAMRNSKLPSQESLGRIRRKLQETDETLRGSKRKESVRLKAQLDYIKYSQE